MLKTRLFTVFVVAGLGLLPMLAAAGERKAAEVECRPAEQKLVYDCMITLKGKKSGMPVADAPNSRSAPICRPCPAPTTCVRRPPNRTESPEPTGRAFDLDMTGEWALKTRFHQAEPGPSDQEAPFRRNERAWRAQIRQCPITAKARG